MQLYKDSSDWRSAVPEIIQTLSQDWYFTRILSSPFWIFQSQDIPSLHSRNWCSALIFLLSTVIVSDAIRWCLKQCDWRLAPIIGLRTLESDYFYWHSQFCVLCNNTVYWPLLKNNDKPLQDNNGSIFNLWFVPITRDWGLTLAIILYFQNRGLSINFDRMKF